MDAYVASKLRGHSAQGQTVPLYLSCQVDGREVMYQTKLAGKRSGLSPRELGIELIGTTIAHEVGLHVARPAMITLPPGMVEEIESRYQFAVEDATAFGCVWKANLTPFLPNTEVEVLSERECALLLALDLVLTNGDRTEPNPNVCWEGDRLLIFDFEHLAAMGVLTQHRRFALHLESLYPLWETHLVRPHVSMSALRRAIEDVLDRMTIDSFLRDSFALPNSWFGPWMDVVEYLGYIKSEPTAFLDRIEDLRL